VLLRLLRIQTTDQGFAVTHDGGATATTTLTITGGNFTSFVRLPDGTMLLSAMVDSNTVPALYRSRDAGATFAQLPSPAIRALSQRDGIAYAATDNFNVGFALGSSSDQGTTWQPVMAYQQIQAVVSCLRGNAQCQASCDMLAGNNGGTMIWDASVCTANPPPSPGTGGSTGTGTGTAGSSGGGGTGMAGAAGASGAGGAGGTHQPKSSGGCAVAAEYPADSRDSALGLGISVLLGLAAVAIFGVRRPPWYGRARSRSASPSRSFGGSG
jgi:hypothetical protein